MRREGKPSPQGVLTLTKIIACIFSGVLKKAFGCDIIVCGAAPLPFWRNGFDFSVYTFVRVQLYVRV